MPRYFSSASILGKCALCCASSARHNSSISRVHAPRVTWDAIGIGVHSESTSASSAAAGAATIVLGFTISVPQKLKARGRRNALVSDASRNGNARRWTLEGCRRDSKRHANAGGAQTRLSNVGQLAAYSVEKLENALAAFSCQTESRSLVRPVNRRRLNQKALGGAHYEVASPPPRLKCNEASEGLQFF